MRRSHGAHAGHGRRSVDLHLSEVHCRNVALTTLHCAVSRFQQRPHSHHSAAALVDVTQQSDRALPLSVVPKKNLFVHYAIRTN